MYFFVFCFKFPERCGYFELKRNKCDVPIYGSMFSRRKLLSITEERFFLSFVLSFCKSIDIHKKNLTMAINTDAANMQKSNK